VDARGATESGPSLDVAENAITKAKERKKKKKDDFYWNFI
jgi:hypothetical protein